MPTGGADFTASVNVDAVIQQNRIFDFYDGGGPDMTCPGMARVDKHGNVIDAYAQMMQYMAASHYMSITRYTSSAFVRRKVGQELRNCNMAPHVFESRDEARAFLVSHSSKYGD